MRELEKRFIADYNKSGLNVFTQLKRDGHVYLYERRREKDNSLHCYEIFRARLIKKGSPLPGGIFEKEDRVAYPGASSFGTATPFRAWFAINLGQAEKIFDDIVKKGNALVIASETEIPEEEEIDTKVSVKKQGEAGKRGRKAVDRDTINIPKDKFTLKQLHFMNPQVSFGFLYQHIRTLIGITIKIEDTIKGRGKPTILYSPIT